MAFHKYSSIENSYQTPYLDKVRDAISLGYIDADMPWVVTEKVHGANYSVMVDSTGVTPAKRTGTLENPGTFYNSGVVLEKHAAAFRDIYNAVLRGHGTPENPVVSVQCYGELFGGSYPHPDVKKISGAVAVQKGIWYAPYNDFYGFDIAVDYADGTREFLSQTEMAVLYESVGIFHATPLFTGTFEECLKYPNAFSTRVPGLLGLPEIMNNICEGVVIKPERDVRLATGDRPLVKNKNDRFKEKRHGPKVLREPEVLPAEVAELAAILEEYVCENRLHNVMSHDVYDMPGDFGHLIKDFTTDILEDFVKDNHARWDLMEKADRKKLTKRMTARAAEVIKEYFRIGRSIIRIER